MRGLRTSVCILAMLFAFLPNAHAKISYAYVSNCADNTVSVINTSNNAVVKTIPVGVCPVGVAVNQAGTFAYVTNQSLGNSGSVSVIRTSTNTIVATIPVQSGPLDVSLTPNGKTAYVLNNGSDSVSVINTGTRKVTATVSVGGAPFDLAVTPNGAFVYVANHCCPSTVSVVSTLTNTVVTTISLGISFPTSVAVSPDGSTAYVTSDASRVAVIRTADNAVVNTINLSGVPWSATVSPDGHWLYVRSNFSGNLVTVIDTSTQTIASTIVVGPGSGEVAFTQDSAFAYVTNRTSNTVSVINTETKSVVNTIPVGVNPAGVALMGTMKVTTVAGGYVGDKGPATSAVLGAPFSTVQDKAGNLYISDYFAHRIRKVSPTGTITTFGGTGICGYNGEDIAAKSAMLCYPTGLAFDSSGNLIVAEKSNFRIRKISKSGKITTIAGNGLRGYSGDGGPATGASLSNPWGVATDAAGNVYFSDADSNVVRRVDSSGTISTYAGNGVAGFSGDGGPATSASLYQPQGIALDSAGNLYIGDLINARVRVVTPTGMINTFAGNGNFGCTGDGAQALNAAIDFVRGITIHNTILYITGGCDRVRAVDLSTNIITTLAGSKRGYDGDNNPPLSSRFFVPYSTIVDSAGSVLVSDTFNDRVRSLNGGVVHTIAGGHVGDGNKATSAGLFNPQGIALDKSGNLYIADTGGNRVRKVSAGTISAVAGTGANGYSGDGGPGAAALLNGPVGVGVDSAGNVFIADSLNRVIRKLDIAGNISTFSANPNFVFPLKMAIDGTNNLYVADAGACVIWKIGPSGVVSAAAGVLFTCGYNGDNIQATAAQLTSPFDVALDPNGNLLIADTFGSRVRLVNSAGVISTIVGDGTCDDSGDGGPAASAKVCTPTAVAVAKSGVIYVADISARRIRKIVDGTITAFAGAGRFFNGDGHWPLSTNFDRPISIAIDSKGALYVADDDERRVRKIK